MGKQGMMALVAAAVTLLVKKEIHVQVATAATNGKSAISVMEGVLVEKVVAQPEAVLTVAIVVAENVRVGLVLALAYLSVMPTKLALVLLIIREAPFLAM